MYMLLAGGNIYKCKVIKSMFPLWNTAAQQFSDSKICLLIDVYLSDEEKSVFLFSHSCVN